MCYRWPGRTCARPWSRAACAGPCPRSICVRFVWYEPCWRLVGNELWTTWVFRFRIGASVWFREMTALSDRAGPSKSHPSHISSHKKYYIMSGRGKGGKRLGKGGAKVRGRARVVPCRVVHARVHVVTHPRERAIVACPSVRPITSSQRRLTSLPPTAPPQGPSRQHPGHHQARHPPARTPWRRQAHLGPHLRGDPRCPQGLPGERDP